MAFKSRKNRPGFHWRQCYKKRKRDLPDPWPNNKNPPALSAGGFLLLIFISLCQHLFFKTRKGTFPDMGAAFRLKRSGAQTAPDLFLLGFALQRKYPPQVRAGRLKT